MTDFAPFSLADVYSKAQAVRGAQQAEQMHEAQLQQLQQQQAIRNRLSDFVGPDGSIDMARAIPPLLQSGDYHSIAALAAIQKATNPKEKLDRAPSPYELDARSRGMMTGHPLVDRMTPDMAKQNLAGGSPGNIAMIADQTGNMVPTFFPRGAGPGAAPGSPNPLGPAKRERIPEKELDTMTKLNSDIRSIDALLGATDSKATPQQKATARDAGVNSDQEATGWKGLVPNELLNRIDPQGVSVRARIGDFSAERIHDRYAGNLTGGEVQRSKKWAVADTDDPAAFVEKLKQQRDVYTNALESRKKTYSAEAGYADHPLVTPAPAQETRTNADSENWVQRTLKKSTGYTRQEIIDEGIKRGKLPKGYK